MWVEYLKTTTKHTEKQNQNNRCLDILLGTEFLLSTPMTSITVYMLKSPISWWHSHLSPRHMCSLPWQLQVGIHRHLKCNFVKVKLILPQIYAFFRVVSSEKKKLFSQLLKTETGMPSLISLCFTLPQTVDLAFNLSHSFTSFHTTVIQSLQPLTGASALTC